MVEDSETPEIQLNLEKIMSIFDKHFPTGVFKRMFKRAFADKVRTLEQNKNMAVCLTRHKNVTDTSFVINKSKKVPG